MWWGSLYIVRIREKEIFAGALLLWKGWLTRRVLWKHSLQIKRYHLSWMRGVLIIGIAVAGVGPGWTPDWPRLLSSMRAMEDGGTLDDPEYLWVMPGRSRVSWLKVRVKIVHQSPSPKVTMPPCHKSEPLLLILNPDMKADQTDQLQVEVQSPSLIPLFVTLGSSSTMVTVGFNSTSISSRTSSTART